MFMLRSSYSSLHFISPVLRTGNTGWLVVICLCESARGNVTEYGKCHGGFYSKS